MVIRLVILWVREMYRDELELFLVARTDQRLRKEIRPRADNLCLCRPRHCIQGVFGLAIHLTNERAVWHLDRLDQDYSVDDVLRICAPIEPLIERYAVTLHHVN